MKKLLLGTIALIFVLVANSSIAQIDTTFWFAAPWVTPSHAGNTPVVFRISTFNSPTTVRIYQPAGTYDSTFVVPPNSLNSHFLTSFVDSLESKPADTPLGYGMKIEADTLITVVYEVVTSGNNPETYSLKGQNALGTEFVCPFQTTWINGSYSPVVPKSMICIVATENNTTIWITPKATVVGHPANTTYSIILQAGEVYTVENTTRITNTPGNNLGGTIIVSDKKIAVTVSDDSVTNSGGGCRDLLGDQIVPVDVIGTEYIVNRGNMYATSQEGMYIVATENFTTVNITTVLGVTTQLLNKGDTYKYILTSTEPRAYVDADKNVYCFQASGFGCEVGAALLPPVNCAGSNQVSFTRTNNQTFILNLLCPTSAINNFVLNGSSTLVPGSASPVPGTSGTWSGAQITFNTTDIPAGTSNLLTNSTDFFGLGVINGGGGTGCYYHYMSSFIRRNYADAGNDTTLCNGVSSFALVGDIKGASTTGIWSVLNGTGTFANPTDLSTTYSPTTSDFSQGELTFVLTSTGNCNPATDTMKVSFIQAPIVTAGADQTYCKNNIPTIVISGGVQFATTAIWSGGNGGAFDNPNDLTTSYTPSPSELADDSVALILTSAGSFYACNNDADTLVVYFSPAPNVIAGSDVFICSNETDINLSGSISGATTTGVWTTNGSGAFSPSQNDLNTDYLIDPADVSAGSFEMVLTSTNNMDCNAETDTIQVTIVPQPTIDITTQDSICSTNAIIPLTGTITGGYGAQWSTSGFGSIGDPNSLNTYYNITAVDTTTGYVDFQLTTVGVCSGNYDTIRVYFVDAPIVVAGNNQSVCSNAFVQLNGNIISDSPMGEWSSLGTGSFSPDNLNLSTTYIPSTGDVANGSVLLILESTNNYGCIALNDTLEVTFLEIPTAAFDVDPACQGDNADFSNLSTFSSGSVVSWEWDFADGTNSSLFEPQHIFNQGGTFPVELAVTASNGCTDTIVQDLIIHYLPEPAFTNNTACEMNTIYFTDQSAIAEGAVTNWNWDFYGFGSSTDQNAEFIFQLPGTYPITLTATSNYGCDASITQNVDVIQSPTADFTALPNPALVGQNINFTDNSTGTNINNWYWDFGDGQAGNAQNPIHDYTNGGVYTVILTATDANNCSDTASQEISIELLPVLPTGFTPNGDGENDVFIIRGGPFKSVDFNIYNNWGELIFNSTDQAIGWDGTYQGSLVPLGVYTWTFVVEMGNGQIIKKSGDVTLLR